jgi:hypothetical protein
VLASSVLQRKVWQSRRKRKAAFARMGMSAPISSLCCHCVEAFPNAVFLFSAARARGLPYFDLDFHRHARHKAGHDS